MSPNAKYAKHSAKARKETLSRSLPRPLRSLRSILRFPGLEVTAMPPDVRKGYALTHQDLRIGAVPQFVDVAPKENLCTINGGAEPPPHIRRQSRELPAW